MQRTELLGELLMASAERLPDRIAIAFPEARIDYATLLEQSRLRARVLHAEGVGTGEHVGIFMPNCLEGLYWIFACALHGAVAVLINARYRPVELGFVLRHADICYLVTRKPQKDTPGSTDILAETCPDLHLLTRGRRPGNAPALRRVVLAGPGKDEPPAHLDDERALIERVRSAAFQEKALQPGAPCLLLYTSGTTSQPKGCVLTHGMLTGKAAAIAGRLRFTSADCQWNPLPLFHLASLMPLFASLATGGRYLSDVHFDAGRAIEQIAREKATILYPAFPTVMAELLTHPEFARLDTRRIRLINNVAPVERLRENMRVLPRAVHISAYGLTEGTGISCYSDLDDDAETRINCIGRPLRDTSLRIACPDTGAHCAVHQRGEIQLSGESVFAGYFREEKANAALFTDDGWLRTGDIGTLDEEGRLAYHGRLKDTLKVGGENVAALEVESLICTHEAVKMVQVVGVPNTRLEEVVAAFVELNPGAVCDADTLIGYCRERIASFKVPRYLRFVDRWPMSATKIQKHRLRERLLAELEKTTYD